jgi:hypothetical protein
VTRHVRTERPSFTFVSKELLGPPSHHSFPRFVNELNSQVSEVALSVSVSFALAYTGYLNDQPHPFLSDFLLAFAFAFAPWYPWLKPRKRGPLFSCMRAHCARIALFRSFLSVLPFLLWWLGGRRDLTHPPRRGTRIQLMAARTRPLSSGIKRQTAVVRRIRVPSSLESSFSLSLF